MKLGVVGTGKIAQEVLPLLSGCGWTVTALCGTERSKATIDTLCSVHKIPQSYADYPMMLREADMETVYLAVPNHLHYLYAKQALEAGFHVIAEKPLVSDVREAEELSALAKDRNLCLFEAVSTLYLPFYQKIKEWLPRIGSVRLVSLNYSQYSSRYDAFRTGNVAPVFDPERSGGALMDLNLYNLHYLVGLFGIPKDVAYRANIERGIDTSGVLHLDYGTFQAVSIAAKDCSAPASHVIQGTDGYITHNMPANQCDSVTLHLNDGTEEQFHVCLTSRLEPEFRFFAQESASADRSRCYALLDHSVQVSRSQTKARIGAGIVFPADREQ